MTTPVAPPAPDTTPPTAAGHVDARPRSAAARSTSTGAPRPTTSASPATRSSAARAPAAPPSRRSAPPAAAPPATATHASSPAPATAIASAPPTPPATWRLLQHRQRHHADAGHDAADAPGTLTATAVSAGEIDLPWGASTDNVGVTGYRVERCQGAGCTDFAQIGDHHRHAPRYSDTGRRRLDTSYSYRVRATDAAGNLGPYSNTASATHPGRAVRVWWPHTPSTRVGDDVAEPRGTATPARSRTRHGRRPASTARRSASTAPTRWSRSPTPPRCS